MHRSRLARFRRTLTNGNADAALLTNPRDIHYLTGFPGEDSWALVTRRGLPIVLSDFRFGETLDALRASLRPHVRPTGVTLPQAAKQAADDVGANRIAFQAEHVSVATRAALARTLGARRITSRTDLLAELRAVKDDAELRAIRRAVRIQQDALLATLPTIRHGQTELEICARLEYEMKARGAEGPSFETIVAARSNGALPHARPGRTRVARGKPLLIDWGARVNGYASDLTRTFSLGSWPPRLREVYGIVLEALEAGVAAVRPGRICAEVDEAARTIIRDAGYGAEFGHSLGHGIGLNIHEGPRVAPHSRTPLLHGMVITIEPGIYLPGIGGVRIEDDVLVTEKGHKRLSSLPRDIDWATL